MSLKEFLGKYREMQPAKRRLLLIAPAVVFLFALMTAPRSPSSVREAATVTASEVADCGITKMRMSIFGRSLMSYDWQSGNCLDASAKSRKAGK